MYFTLIFLLSHAVRVDKIDYAKPTWRTAIHLHSSKKLDEHNLGQGMLVELSSKDRRNLAPVVALLEEDLLSESDWGVRIITLHKCWYALEAVPDQTAIEWVLRNTPQNSKTALPPKVKSYVESLVSSEQVSKRLASYPALDHAVNSRGADEMWAKRLLPQLLKTSSKDSNQASILLYEFLTCRRVE